MPWDVDAAVKHLREHAGPPYGVGKCATYVRRAIEAGGVPVSRAGSGDAKDYGPRLTKAGFVAQAAGFRTYRKGDVALIDGFEGAPRGHLAMFDGSTWISDFRQAGDDPYPGSRYRKAAPTITIYRHP